MRKLYFGFMSVLTLLFSSVVFAQPASIEDAQFPTLVALQSVDIPERDRVDLARRLRGVEQIAPPPVNPPPFGVGTRRSFWVTNSDEQRQFQIEAELLAASEHLYIWGEVGSNIPARDAEALAATFDAQIYGQVRALWGSEDLPGIDGDPRVHALFASDLGFTTAGYFASDHTNPVEVLATSNEAEMFFINLDATGPLINIRYVENILAHEFQHMIRANLDDNEDSWMDEGYSTFTELILGYSEGSVNFADVFLNNPRDQLNTWTETGDRAVDYGSALLFVTYFYERYGEAGLRALSENPDNGLLAVDSTLTALGEPGVDSFFADWVLANGLMDRALADGQYGYRLLSGFAPARTQSAVLGATLQGALPQYSSDYYQIASLDGLQRLNINVELPQTVDLVPTHATSGQFFWYSNRGDQSDTTLTRQFDLSGVSSATLEYNVWYHTEDRWDYGYVMASRDGQQWEILPTSHTTTDNPHNTAYGAGYTGESGGWLAESLSLDAYAGGQVYIRFEMITDDAVNQPGMAIDDLRIPEIGYSADFESGDDGWIAAGWVRVDNRLPQRAWVQAVQRVNGELFVTRWEANGTAAWSLDLAPGAESVLIAVSPFAPVTTVPTQYSLTVTGE